MSTCSSSDLPLLGPAEWPSHECSKKLNAFSKETASASIKNVHLGKNQKFGYNNARNLIYPISLVKQKKIADQKMVLFGSRTLPAEFNWYLTGGRLIEPGNRNQYSCGCCWAMAIASVVGDRFAIKHKCENPILSAAWLIMCENTDVKSNQQCACGGNPLKIAQTLVSNEGGIPLKSCFDFDKLICKDKDNCNAPRCPIQGTHQQLVVKIKLERHYSLLDFLTRCDSSNVAHCLNEVGTINTIKGAIMRGPVLASFFVSGDWESYMETCFIGQSSPPTTVYIPAAKIDPLTHKKAHSVVLVGWGTVTEQEEKEAGDASQRKGLRYWVVRNSWGYPGFFRFAFSLDTNRNNWTGLDIPFLENKMLNNKPLVIMGAHEFIVVKEDDTIVKRLGLNTVTKQTPVGPPFKKPTLDRRPFYMKIMLIIAAIITGLLILIFVGAKLFYN